jgi:hypothetical protein
MLDPLNDRGPRYQAAGASLGLCIAPFASVSPAARRSLRTRTGRQPRRDRLSRRSCLRRNAAAPPARSSSMQPSTRGPSGPGHRARLLSWKDHLRRGRCGLPTRRAGAIRRRRRTPPLPRHRPRCGATPIATRAPRAARAVLGLDIRARATRSGRTSAVVSASARHAFGVGATTRSPCRLHGLLPVSPGGSREMRHALVSVGDQNFRSGPCARRPKRVSAENR